MIAVSVSVCVNNSVFGIEFCVFIVQRSLVCRSGRERGGTCRLRDNWLHPRRKSNVSKYICSVNWTRRIHTILRLEWRSSSWLYDVELETPRPAPAWRFNCKVFKDVATKFVCHLPSMTWVIASVRFYIRCWDKKAFVLKHNFIYSKNTWLYETTKWQIFGLMKSNFYVLSGEWDFVRFMALSNYTFCLVFISYSYHQSSQQSLENK